MRGWFITGMVVAGILSVASAVAAVVVVLQAMEAINQYAATH